MKYYVDYFKGDELDCMYGTKEECKRFIDDTVEDLATYANCNITLMNHEPQELDDDDTIKEIEEELRELEREAVNYFKEVKAELLRKEDKNLELLGLKDEPQEFMGNDGEWHCISHTSKCISDLYINDDGPLPF